MVIFAIESTFLCPGLDFLQSTPMEKERIRQCAVCMSPYSNETFIRPCFHSFCFECICYWINLTPDESACPVCRQQVEILVYNIDETNDTFDEYHLKDRKGERHYPPLDEKSLPKKKRAIAHSDQTQAQRRQLYQQKWLQPTYPTPLPRHQHLNILMPEHIPRVKQFLEYELSALYGPSMIDPFVLNHITDILLIPYDSADSSPMSMEDPILLKKLSEWLSEEDSAILRLLRETMAYVQCGLSYRDFVASTVYP
ncbi:hypothetical protein BY458DRAFT_492398 [Sporodiniella umbellata]|nr:hypothetical protein BY458DRAFT_492398 [Sporodiniella umbellata]